MQRGLAFIEGVGGLELLMILFVVLMLFGSQRLPDLARGLGRSIREFRKATSGVEEEIKRIIETPPSATSVPPTKEPDPVEKDVAGDDRPDKTTSGPLN
jgi:TatA/E family protein of Tat protein translocase